MSMVDHGSACSACVCRCSSGFCSASRPAIHILAGEKVCIQAIRPTHAGELLASSTRWWIDPESMSTGFQTTSTGSSPDDRSRSAMRRDWEATCSSVSGP